MTDIPSATPTPIPTLAHRRNASLAVLARVSVNWAMAGCDMARAGRLAAELRRLSAASPPP